MVREFRSITDGLHAQFFFSSACPDLSFRLLPGIADEGPTYEAEDVFILEKGMIFGVQTAFERERVY
jgi:hypothetical protein